MNPARRPHPLLLLLLAATIVYGSVAAWRRMNRQPGRWVGYTECSWRGRPRIVVWSGLRRIDSLAVIAHESVHVAECEQLGPVRYRWRTMFAASNLALETPAYCAGARERARLNGDTAFLRMTTAPDMIAAMGDVIDSATIVRSIAANCPEFLPRK
jgi:hypothetical protein